LITSAPRNKRDEIDARRRRYLWTMGVRTVAFVLAIVLFHGAARVVAAVIALVLPMVAVIAANAGSPPSAERPSWYRRGQRQLEQGPRAGLPGGGPSDRPD
jgi:hypothetical protein